MKIFRLWKVTVRRVKSEKIFLPIFCQEGVRHIESAIPERPEKILIFRTAWERREYTNIIRGYHVTHKPVTLMQWIKGEW